MRRALGFDGGGTKTECVLMDEDQNILSRSRSGPSNPVRVGVEAAVAALRDAAQRAISNARGEPQFIAALCAGLAGAGDQQKQKQMLSALEAAFPGTAVNVCTDLDLALAATGSIPAMILIGGTGSAVIGRDALGRVSRAGGYGPVIGDEGSAYDIGRRATLAALREHDRTGADSALGKQILRQLGCARWAEVQQRASAAPDEVFPRIFPVVAAAADAEDETARSLLRDAARALAALVKIVAERMRLAESVFLLAKTGGVFGRSRFLDGPLDEMLREIVPGANFGPLPMAPAEAAARLGVEMLHGIAPGN